MELADLLVVNKADGPLLPIASATLADYSSALRLLRPRSQHWTPEALLASALTGFGIPEVWELLQKYRSGMTEYGAIDAQRAEQSQNWLWDELKERIIDRFRSDPIVAESLVDIEKQVSAGAIPPGIAADLLISRWIRT
jgi:LAO/AO transport system kinase